MKRPDTTQMRRELALHHIEVRCTRPGWSATRASDNFSVTGQKMRLVIAQAYQKLKKG